MRGSDNILHNYACMVWLRMTEFGMVSQMEEKHVSRGLEAPSQGAGPSIPKLFGTPYLCPNGAMKFGVLTRGWLACSDRASHAPNLKGWGPSIPKMFVDILYYIWHTVWETTTKFCMVIKLDVRIIFASRPRMQSHDLFVVANLLVKCVTALTTEQSKQ